MTRWILLLTFIVALVCFAPNAMRLVAGPDENADPPSGSSPRAFAPADITDARRPLLTTSIEGMTISCHGIGQAWGTDAMVDAMRELKALGVNWIAIHPYASISADGTVGSSSRYSNPEWISRPIREAHALGLKIMIKPHIAYWGSPFSWRGDISFDTEEEWTRFFTTYQAWITSIAEIAKDADLYAVGTELDRTIHFEQKWRNIIAAIRDKTDAPLTYASNWDQYHRVQFWDDLDAVGVQGYFPLVSESGVPDQKTLALAWDRLIAHLDGFAARWNRPVILTELGYNRSSQAALEPWDYKTGGPGADEIQARCLTAALDALSREDRVIGPFLWKWFPDSGRSRGGNFLKSTPTMRSVIHRGWGETRNSMPATAPATDSPN